MKVSISAAMVSARSVMDAMLRSSACAEICWLDFQPRALTRLRRSRPYHSRSNGARLIVETDEYRSFIDRLSFGHDRICRKTFIGPAQRDAFHDDLIVGNSRVLTHHR